MKSEKRIYKKNRNSTIVACHQIHVSYIKIKVQEVVLLIAATRYKSGGLVSIPDGVTESFH